MLGSGSNAKAEFQEDLPRFMHNVLNAFKAVGSDSAIQEIGSPTSIENDVDPDAAQPNSGGDPHIDGGEHSDSDDKDSQPKKRSMARGFVTQNLMKWRSKCFNSLIMLIFVQYLF